MVGIKKIGDVKKSVANGIAKELRYMIHGAELREGIVGGTVGTRQRWAQEENYDNCNSIINKIYLKK